MLQIRCVVKTGLIINGMGKVFYVFASKLIFCLQTLATRDKFCTVKRDGKCTFSRAFRFSSAVTMWYGYLIAAAWAAARAAA